MLEFAQKKAKMQGIRNIQFHNAGFLTYEHTEEPVDAIVSQLALHHLPDFWKMIALRRVFGMLKEELNKLLMRNWHMIQRLQFEMSIQLLDGSWKSYLKERDSI